MLCSDPVKYPSITRYQAMALRVKVNIFVFIFVFLSELVGPEGNFWGFFSFEEIADHVINKLKEYGWAVVDNFFGPDHCRQALGYYSLYFSLFASELKFCIFSRVMIFSNIYFIYIFFRGLQHILLPKSFRSSDFLNSYFYLINNFRIQVFGSF